MIFKQQTKRTVPLILCISLPFPLILFYIYKQGKEDGRNGYSHGLTMMIQVIIMITMKQNIKKAMKVAMMMDIQKVNPNMRMKMNS